jgi:hypothetical protein
MSQAYGMASDWWLQTTRHDAHWLALAAGHAPSGVVRTDMAVADLLDA